MQSKVIPRNEVMEEHFEIASYHMDPFGDLKLSSLFELIQNAASKDAARKGFGYRELIETNRYWVLIRALVQISKLPRWEEKVCFKTWPKESTGIVAFRDFILENAEGEILVKATSTWTQLNTLTRRPVRIELDDDLPINHSHAILEKPAKVSIPKRMDWSGNMTVKYSQIDVNKHVNNTRYLEWVLNELPFEVLKEKRVTEMEVNFLSEGMLDDALRVGTACLSDLEYFGCVERVGDGQKLYSVKFLFGSR